MHKILSDLAAVLDRANTEYQLISASNTLVLPSKLKMLPDISMATIIHVYDDQTAVVGVVVLFPLASLPRATVDNAASVFQQKYSGSDVLIYVDKNGNLNFSTKHLSLDGCGVDVLTKIFISMLKFANDVFPDYIMYVKSRI
jgi:hypothetical protein